MGKETSHIRALCLADKRAAAPLPCCNSLAKASVMPDCHAARLMKDNAQVLGGCRPRDNMPVSELLSFKMTSAVFRGLMVGPKPRQKAYMLSRSSCSCSTAAFQDSKTIFSAHTRAETHVDLL